MPKRKPHKGLQKRVKVTARGKVVRRRAGKAHLMSSKPGKRRRRLGRPGLVAPADRRRVRRLLAQA